jgi:hypothetical protein
VSFRTYSPEQIQVNRAIAVAELLKTKEPQGRRSCYEPSTGCYCAIGVIARAAGYDLKKHQNDPAAEANAYNFVEATLGLGRSGAEKIWKMNDLRHFKFATIGKRLAAEWEIEVPNA